MQAPERGYEGRASHFTFPGSDFHGSALIPTVQTVNWRSKGLIVDSAPAFPYCYVGGSVR